jgi:hypothetical protein
MSSEILRKVCKACFFVIVRVSGDDWLGVLIVKSGEWRVYFMSEDEREITLYRMFPDLGGIMSWLCKIVSSHGE